MIKEDELDHRIMGDYSAIQIINLAKSMKGKLFKMAKIEELKWKATNDEKFKFNVVGNFTAI